MKYIQSIFYILFLSVIFSAYPYHTLGVGIYGTDIIKSATFYHSSNIHYGLDFVHIGVEMSDSQTYDWDNYEDETYSSSSELSLNLLMPRIGYRRPHMTFGSVQTYNQIEGYLIYPMVKTSGEANISNDEEDQIEDALTLFGIKAGHSLEYNFTKQLSLVTDVGLNWIFWGNTIETSDDYSNYTYETENKVTANLAMTYIKLSLHFKLQN